jgi:serine/threonine protein phosphatase PrpC
MAADTEPGWQPEGRFEFSIGEPGQAFRQVRSTLPFFPVQPDSVSDGGTAGGLAIRAASVRGLHHRYDGKPRQDSYGAALSEDGQWLIAVVADGVGKGPKSQNAAALVSRHGPELIRDRLASAGTAPSELDWWSVFEQLAIIIVKDGQRNLEKPSSDRGTRGTVPSAREVASEMASTATFAICHTAPSVQDGWKVTVASQGDSPVWALSAGGRWRRLAGPKPLGADGLATSKVLALPLLPAERGTHLVTTEILTPDCALLLMSDGVGDPLGDADDDVAATLGQAWARPPLQHQFTAQIGFGRKGFDDDRTVVGIWADGVAFVNGGREPQPADVPEPGAVESTRREPGADVAGQAAAQAVQAGNTGQAGHASHASHPEEVVTDD